jgi:hypothetical protein
MFTLLQNLSLTTHWTAPRSWVYSRHVFPGPEGKNSHLLSKVGGFDRGDEILNGARIHRRWFPPYITISYVIRPLQCANGGMYM